MCLVMFHLFLEDEYDGNIRTVVPPKRCIAVSNEHIVRVDGSKKTLFKILPFNKSQPPLVATMSHRIGYLAHISNLKSN